jgi:hypothetical protein
MRTTCPDCRQPHDRRRKVRLHFETVAGQITVFHEVEGRKVFNARCPNCKREFQIDGGRA